MYQAGGSRFNKSQWFPPNSIQGWAKTNKFLLYKKNIDLKQNKPENTAQAIMPPNILIDLVLI